MHEKMMPLYNAVPLLLIIYGALRSLFEVLELKATKDGLLMVADSSLEQRYIYLSAYVRALDSFFFYLGMAALVAVACRYAERLQA